MAAQKKISPITEKAAAARMVLLHEADNVYVAVDTIPAGSVYAVEGLQLTSARAIASGHKIARLRLSPGDKIIKYGAPVGSATQEIRKGEHVHTHNMRSDYIPTHSRDELEGEQ